jgi:outer membrane receptor protein involved in Fe transport
MHKPLYRQYLNTTVTVTRRTKKIMRRFVLYIYQPNLFNGTVGLAILFFLFTFSSEAQKENGATGKITGRIIDSLTDQPIEYATISLLTQVENKVVNGATADGKGVFKLTNVSEGTYKMLIDFIGYKKREMNNIVVNRQNPSVVMGDIKLSSKQTRLKEVTITAEKSFIENKIDKMVYNAEKDITSQSGVAADVLKKVPQVSVDVDGNVELQGNSNIRFLINGKPSILFGSNISDVLQSIPSSQIQSIEIITSPGAKYDAEGTGGIINIILKKNNAHGINGNISLSGGTRLENGSINLNVRKGKFGANVYLCGNAQLLSTTINNMDRSSRDTSATSRLLQNGKSDFRRNGYQSGVGFDWDITPKDNITGTLGYDYFGNNNIGNADRETLLQDASGNQLSDINDVVNTSNKFHEYSYDWDLGYKKKFKKEGQELEFLFNSSNGNIYSYYEQTQRHLSPDAIFNSSYGENPGIENETNVEVNYTQPLSENAILEAGAKAEHDHINSISNVYLLNTSSDSYDFNTEQSSSVDYKRTVYAGYISATFKLFKLFDIKTGCRDEYTMAKADFSNSGSIDITPYNTIVPSMVISHTLKNKQMLKISYTHRIERPDYRDMNPFINSSDPKNITSGNPNLRPEIGDKIELGYNQTFKNGATITPTLFYRGNKDDIQSYTNFYPTYKIGDSTYTNVAVSMRENIGREDNFGLSLFASIPLTQKINLRANISCFQRYINTGMASGGNIQGFNYRTNINASYQLSSTLIIELLGNFNSPRINAQGKMPSFTTYNFAFRKQLFHKKGSFAITATNFFNKYVNQKTKLTGENFTLANTRQLPYRSFGFNFTYKFGKMEFKKEKEIEDINLTNPQGN